MATMVAVDIETREGLRRVDLAKPRLTIGRLPGNDIVLPFAQISRHHAEVRQRGNDWWIIDLGSTNGLRVGGRVVKEYLLHDGDVVILAPHINVHFIDGRRAAEVVEGSTIPLKAVAGPVATAQERELPAGAISGTIHAPAAAQDPGPSADRLAAAAAVPLPRRNVGWVAPPSLVAAPLKRTAPPSPLPERPTTPNFPDAEGADNWLNDGGEPATSAPVPANRDPVDLPLSTPFALMRQKGDPLPAPPPRPLLYTCAICGERTAPDSPYCWSCHSTIAQPCPACQLYLLPIQAKCPRCEAANPHSVRPPGK